MIDEEEAFWAGIAVAALMLGGGFSMLFMRTLIGEAAVVLALGLTTMVLTMQMRARPRRYIEPLSPVEARELAPTPPVESSTEPEQTQTETQAEQQTSQPQEEAIKPEATKPIEQPQPKPVEPPQPAQQEPPVEEKNEPPPPEAPQEEPIVVF